MKVIMKEPKKLGRPRTNTKVLFRRIPTEHFCLIAEMVDCRLNEIKTVQHNSQKKSK
jgi:hypothetical protein